MRFECVSALFCFQVSNVTKDNVFHSKLLAMLESIILRIAIKESKAISLCLIIETVCKILCQ